jgi:transmembrane 9 superfamily protein 2/4
VLRGDRIASSGFNLRMNVDQTCQVLCSKKLNKDQTKQLRRLIAEEYKAEWIVDDLPSATAYSVSSGPLKKQYEAGFKTGVVKDGKTLLFNHVNFKFYYSQQPNGGKYVVGFEVYPKSVEINDKKCPSNVNDASLAPQQVGENDQEFTFTYSTYWIEEPDIKYGNRWDLYLTNNTDPQIHWYSIINSVVILLFLSAMVAIILLRTLNNDIAAYNDEEIQEEQDDVTGWKLVHGDVFRPPPLGGLLAPLLGSGIQFSATFFFTMMLSMSGLLNPAVRGGLVSAALFLFAFSGAFGGYWSARLFKFFKGTAWQRNAFLTAVLVPGLLFLVAMSLNFFMWASSASNAIPFGTLLVLCVMWIFISLPLVFVGAYFGFKKQVIENPVRTHQIPRQIPEQVWYLQPLPNILIAGLLPFGVIFIELFFMLKSAWSDQYYYMFGFLGLVASILVVTVVEIDIVIAYFQLCAEDYHWWWRSFAVGAASGIYMFLCKLHLHLGLTLLDAIYYFMTRLNITDFTSILIYVVQAFMGSVIYSLSLGTLGFYSTFWFLRRIFASVKVD